MPFSLIAQKNCVDFANFESSQTWIKELKKLDSNSKKDSILNRIKCERFFREENIEHFETIFIINGYFVTVPEYRDTLLIHIKAENIILLENSFNMHKHHGEKGHRLGVLLIEELDKPIIDNIEKLTILKVERAYKRKRITDNNKIRIKLKCSNPQEFTFRIENFSDKSKYKTKKIHIKKITRTIDFSIDREAKVISIIDSENNLITIII